MAAHGNEQPFRFLDIPLELRNRIYSLTFLPLYEFQGAYLTGRIRGASLQILRANRQIWEEAWKELYVGWSSTTVHIPEASILSRLKHALPEPLKITHLQLSFSQKGYIIFFGGKVGSKLQRVVNPRALVLRSLPLQSLELEIPHPKRMQGTIFAGGCNDVVADWICRFAIPFVKHVPVVTISGYIKRSRKAAFQGLLANAVEKDKLPKPVWMQGHDFYERTVIPINDDDLPPVCLCLSPCAADGEFNVEE